MTTQSLKSTFAMDFQILTPGPTSQGLSWTNCPDEALIKEDIKGETVTTMDREDDLVLAASCSAGSGCGTLKYNFSTTWDFTLSPILFIDLEDEDQTAADQSSHNTETQLQAGISNKVPHCNSFFFGNRQLRMYSGLALAEDLKIFATTKTFRV